MRPGRAYFRAAVAALLFAPAAGFAAAGEEGFGHLAEGPGARAAAMGGTGISLGGDADGAFWNPAALGATRARELSFSHAARGDFAADNSLTYVHPSGPGAYGARMFIRRVEEMDGYDASGGKTSSYGASDAAATLAYGRSFGRRLKAGLAVKQARQSIGGFSGSVVAVDAGVLVPLSSLPVTWAAGVRNAGGKAAFLQEKTALPLLIDGGATARFFSDALAVSLEGHRLGDDLFWNAGLELWAYNLMAFRAGLDSRRDVGGGASFGFGVKLKRLRLDYALAPQGEAFGPAHRLSLAFRFGGGGEAAYQTGLALSQREDFAGAILKFKEALDADPDHPAAARALKEAVISLERRRSRR